MLSLEPHEIFTKQAPLLLSEKKKILNTLKVKDKRNVTNIFSFPQNLSLNQKQISTLSRIYFFVAIKEREPVYTPIFFFNTVIAKCNFLWVVYLVITNPDF